MKWLAVIQLITTALGLAIEFIKMRTEKEKTAREKAKLLNSLRIGIKKQRKEKDTSELEAAFSNVGIDLGLNLDNIKLPDKQVS